MDPQEVLVSMSNRPICSPPEGSSVSIGDESPGKPIGQRQLGVSRSILEEERIGRLVAFPQKPRLDGGPQNKHGLQIADIEHV